jgi:hypothetical protein
MSDNFGLTQVQLDRMKAHFHFPMAFCVVMTNGLFMRLWARSNRSKAS